VWADPFMRKDVLIAAPADRQRGWHPILGRAHSPACGPWWGRNLHHVIGGAAIERLENEVEATIVERAARRVFRLFDLLA